MTSDSENHREEGVRKLAEPAGAAIRPDARREANRLGSDTYLVDQDMEDSDQREGQDRPDGRPSPLANADNPER
ncbi:hypothetical protein ACQKP1_05895 [Allorhizobium sp. NPDC080224]|uniref:hypothetical protein n=1 Tax=Allorhizobium sp. NPDC080224 TaxID=3390547 RepID=UPI003D032AB5